jgi:heterodisulfide reductase subunit C
MYQTKQALDLLVQQIDQKVKQIEEDLGAKTAKDYSEYCVQCGVITGLLTARRNIADLTKNLENSDE